MRRILLLLAALLPAFVFVPRPPAPCAGKPTAPIRLETRLDGDPAGAFEIVASADSPLASDVDLEIVLPPDVAHRGGARSASARRPALRVEGRSPDRGRREILVRATVTEGTARLTRVVSVVLNDAPAPAPGALRRNSRGETILEFGP